MSFWSSAHGHGHDFPPPLLSIKEALEQHKDALKRLRSSIPALETATEATPGEFDDIFLLRFILSAKDFDRALQNAAATVEWRTANREVLRAVRETGRAPHHDVVAHHLVQGPHKSLVDGTPVYIIRSGISNTKELSRVASVPTVAEWILFQREQMFDMCDKITRKTGFLSKMFVILDGSHARLTGLNLHFINSVSAASSKSEIYYPQLLLAQCFINMPTFFRTVILPMAKRVMPKKAMEKSKFCGVKSTVNLPPNDPKPLSKCPFASRMMKPEDVPTFLGGRCMCPVTGATLESALDPTAQGPSSPSWDAGRRGSGDSFKSASEGADPAVPENVDAGESSDARTESPMVADTNPADSGVAVASVPEDESREQNVKPRTSAVRSDATLVDQHVTHEDAENGERSPSPLSKEVSPESSGNIPANEQTPPGFCVTNVPNNRSEVVTSPVHAGMTK
ncbi:hypothetical protein M427DRAFT_133599 [Gonapodya prolifera JEL478]|uniref:CRAL-TRIO domain-containing protein n=1 Tax=Gonapodya prolifera (strain JEL478) TaxID=1344416 RepID=A0A139AL45_GONPJ|nr:hypothetical protein M427DRAFT_133599 [Gonapodya prolifera JEL478]|eukprot:KXS17135.1 hypothetical protein M427DRAFT_133599 [Gonapodya prolifera JEL478]